MTSRVGRGARLIALLAIFAQPGLAAPSPATGLAPSMPGQPGGTPRQGHLAALAGQVVGADTPVFIGGTLGLGSLASVALVAPMLATGRIGLYQHAVGMGSLGPPGVAALLAAWGLGNGGGRGVCETGAIANYDPAVIGDYMALFGINRQYPNACVMNLPGSQTGSGTYTAPPGAAKPGTSYAQFVTPSDLAAAEAAITAALAHGAHQVAVNDTPNSYAPDLDDPFATSGYWANVRALYAFGGAGALDVPPSYFVAREPAYRQTIIQQIRWLNAQGLGSYVLVSPFLYAGADAAGNTYASAYDPLFFEHLVQMVGVLKQAGALPTHWVVENYAPPSAVPPATANAPDTTPEGLVAAALWLATAGRTAHAGTAPSGANGWTDAGQQVRCRACGTSRRSGIGAFRGGGR